MARYDLGFAGRLAPEHAFAEKGEGHQAHLASILAPRTGETDEATVTTKATRGAMSRFIQRGYTASPESFFQQVT